MEETSTWKSQTSTFNILNVFDSHDLHASCFIHDTRKLVPNKSNCASFIGIIKGSIFQLGRLPEMCSKVFMQILIIHIHQAIYGHSPTYNNQISTLNPNYCATLCDNLNERSQWSSVFRIATTWQKSSSCCQHQETHPQWMKEKCQCQSATEPDTVDMLPMYMNILSQFNQLASAPRGCVHMRNLAPN